MSLLSRTRRLFREIHQRGANTYETVRNTAWPFRTRARLCALLTTVTG
jgi:hypothetical protein